MTDTHRNPHAESHDRLRRSARDLIDHGVPPPSRGGNLGVDALRLLYDRASTPESAADALKLLHEMQTYQVELDLLYEQLQANELEINEDLVYYRSLYEQAPAAYLIIANDGEIIEGNEAAGGLFGESATDLAGKALGTLLAPGQESAVNTLLRILRQQHPESKEAEKSSLELADRRRVTVSARVAAGSDSIMVILTEATTHPTGS